MRQIVKEDIVKLYAFMQEIKYCKEMAGYHEGCGNTYKFKKYTNRAHDYWNKFMEIIFDTYGSRNDFMCDLQEWQKEEWYQEIIFD